jgi:PE-PPE domain
MRNTARTFMIVVLSVLTTVVLGVASAFMAALALGAAALIVPGTGTPNANIVGEYRENFRNYYMQETACNDVGNCPSNDTGDPVNGGLFGINYPASFWPLVIIPGWCVPGRCEKFDVSVAEGVDNLDNPGPVDPGALTALLNAGYAEQIVIAGYSQGARVVTVEKIKFANGDFGDLTDQVSFVYIGNPNRPNGGLLSRLGILGHIPILDVTTGQSTPTNTGYDTYDYAIRWEGIADAPLYLLNPLAWANSLLGFYYDHGTYLAVNQDSDPGELPGGWPVDQWQDFIDHPELYPDIVDVQEFGDTTYYTITPKVLPLVRPLHAIPVIGKPIADLIEPALRVIIEETGYDRSIPSGQPAPLRLIPIFNPITLALKLIPAIVQGIGAFLSDLGLSSAVAPAGPAEERSILARQQAGDPQQAKLPDEPDESSLAPKMRLVPDDATLTQQLDDGEGDETTFVTTSTGNEFTTSNGTLTPTAEDTTELDEKVVEEEEESEEINGGSEELTNDPEELTNDPEELTNDPEELTKDREELTKDREERKGPEENKNGASGRSVSLNFSPNKPERVTGGDATGQPDPSGSPAPTQGSEGPEGSEQAAA